MPAKNPEDLAEQHEQAELCAWEERMDRIEREIELRTEQQQQAKIRAWEERMDQIEKNLELQRSATPGDVLQADRPQGFAGDTAESSAREGGGDGASPTPRANHSINEHTTIQTPKVVLRPDSNSPGIKPAPPASQSRSPKQLQAAGTAPDTWPDRRSVTVSSSSINSSAIQTVQTSLSSAEIVEGRSQLASADEVSAQRSISPSSGATRADETVIFGEARDGNAVGQQTRSKDYRMILARLSASPSSPISHAGSTLSPSSDKSSTATAFIQVEEKVQRNLAAAADASPVDRELHRSSIQRFEKQNAVGVAMQEEHRACESAATLQASATARNIQLLAYDPAPSHATSAAKTLETQRRQTLERVSHKASTERFLDIDLAPSQNNLPAKAVPARSRVPRLHVVWSPTPPSSHTNSKMTAKSQFAPQYSEMTRERTSSKVEIRSKLASARAAVASAKAAASHQQKLRERVKISTYGKGLSHEIQRSRSKPVHASGLRDEMLRGRESPGGVASIKSAIADDTRRRRRARRDQRTLSYDDDTPKSTFRQNIDQDFLNLNSHPQSPVQQLGVIVKERYVDSHPTIGLISSVQKRQEVSKRREQERRLLREQMESAHRDNMLTTTVRTETKRRELQNMMDF
eukprot:SAG31_NODE_1280_length_9033_cov_11.049810_6_plen_635_part_00